MNIASGAMVFFVIWWIVLFTVLPFGVRPDDNPLKGSEKSAPKNPKLKQKFLMTTVLTALIWGVIQFIMINRLISFS